MIIKIGNNNLYHDELNKIDKIIRNYYVYIITCPRRFVKGMRSFFYPKSFQLRDSPPFVEKPHVALYFGHSRT